MFSKIKIHGNSDINYVWSKTGSVQETEIQNLLSQGVATPEWDESTIALSTFWGNINASETYNLGTILKFAVQRHDINSGVRQTVKNDCPTNGSILLDFNVANNCSYKYYIIPIFKNSSNEEGIYGQPIVTDVITPKWDTWSLIGLIPTDNPNIYHIDKDNIWTLGLNIQTDPFSIKNDKIFSDGYNKYPRVYVGKTDYLTSKVSCYLGNVSCNGDYTDDNMVKITKWREFCNNGQLKLLRDRKGHVIPCEIHDESYSIQENLIEMPTTISFSFTELLDSRNISVCEIGE